MTKTTLYSILATCLLLAFQPAHAEGFVHADTTPYIPPTSLSVDDTGAMTYDFIGKDAEEGVVKLFVKNVNNTQSYDPTAEDLNRITPAAGVKLYLEF